MEEMSMHQLRHTNSYKWFEIFHISTWFMRISSINMVKKCPIFQTKLLGTKPNPFEGLSGVVLFPRRSESLRSQMLDLHVWNILAGEPWFVDGKLPFSWKGVAFCVPESSFRGAGWMMFGVPKKHHPYRVKTAKEKRERDWEDKDFEMRWGKYSVTPNSQIFLLIYILRLFILMGIAGDFECPIQRSLSLANLEFHDFHATGRFFWSNPLCEDKIRLPWKLSWNTRMKDWKCFSFANGWFSASSRLIFQGALKFALLSCKHSCWSWRPGPFLWMSRWEYSSQLAIW